ncbi:MAG: DUF2730 family protein [Ideonella sp.]|nr:DUF2730 family protein [Ideonella sp.]MCC7455975.1 DUF2730 family protein [Nitrospira sp.]
MEQFDLVLRGLVMFNTLATAVIGLVLWLRKPGEDAKHEVTEVRASVAKLDADMRLVQQEISHLPTRQEVGGLAQALAALEAQTEAQTQTLNMMRSTLSRIEDYLLQRPSR